MFQAMTMIHPTDPLTRLPGDAYRHLFLTLRAAMPPAADDARAAHLRDQAAVAQVAGLCPANAAEAALAAQFVAANANALACLALVQRPGSPADDGARHAATANTMMRRAQDALALLVRLQNQRTKRDADTAGADQAAWMEHAASAWMLEASPGETTQRAERQTFGECNTETDPTLSAPRTIPPPTPPDAIEPPAEDTQPHATASGSAAAERDGAVADNQVPETPNRNAQAAGAATPGLVSLPSSARMSQDSGHHPTTRSFETHMRPPTTRPTTPGSPPSHRAQAQPRA
jgi:hypothetical protein